MLTRRVAVTAADDCLPATGRPVRFLVEVSALFPGTIVEQTRLNQLGLPVVQLGSGTASPDIRAVGTDPVFVCELDALPLLPGRYGLDVVARGSGQVQDDLPAALLSDVSEGAFRGRPVSKAVPGGGDVVVPPPLVHSGRLTQR